MHWLWDSYAWLTPWPCLVLSYQFAFCLQLNSADLSLLSRTTLTFNNYRELSAHHYNRTLRLIEDSIKVVKLISKFVSVEIVNLEQY